LGRGVQKDGRYAVSVEPTVVPLHSLEADVPSNFNLATLHGETIDTLKFYGQGAGSLPTGNAMVQDLLDYQAGVKPEYKLSDDKTYDSSLLTQDYLVRTTSKLPKEAKPYLEGYHVLKNLTSVQAREVLDQLLVGDPKALMVAVSKEVSVSD